MLQSNSTLRTTKKHKYDLIVLWSHISKKHANMLKEHFKLSLYLHLHYAGWCISNLSASTSLTGFVPPFLLLLLHLAFARPLFPLPSKTKNEEKRPMQTFRPYNIAHRGSNGEIPEETAAAYLVLLRKLQSRKIIAGFHFFYFANGKRIFFISRYT